MTIMAKVMMPDKQNKKKLKILVKWMKKLVNMGKRDLFVRRFVANLLNKSRVNPKDSWNEIKTLHKFVRDNIIYRRDPHRVEFFQTPRRMLKDYINGSSAGDCDDKSILLSSMIETIGYRTALVLVNPRGGQFTHVLPFVEYPVKSNRWIPLETTLPVSPGWMPKTYKKLAIKIS